MVKIKTETLEPPNTHLHMKLDAELKEDLKKLAAADSRTLTNFIAKILTDYVKSTKKSGQEGA